jgi:hypothetical protein
MWSNLINFKSRHKLTLVAMGHQIGSFSDQALNGSEKDPGFFDVQHFTGHRGTASDLECNICKTPCNQHGKPCRNMLTCWIVLGTVGLCWVIYCGLQRDHHMHKSSQVCMRPKPNPMHPACVALRCFHDAEWDYSVAFFVFAKYFLLVNTSWARGRHGA